MSTSTPRRSRGHRLDLGEALTLMATMAFGLALDRAYAPTLFTRSASGIGVRLAILAIILIPCVALGAMALLAMRVLLARLRWWPPAQLVTSLAALGLALVGAIGVMDLVMQLVVALAE